MTCIQDHISKDHLNIKFVLSDINKLAVVNGAKTRASEITHRMAALTSDSPVYRSYKSLGCNRL